MRVIGILEDGQLVFQDDELATEQPDSFPSGIYVSGETLEEFGEYNLWEEELDIIRKGVYVWTENSLKLKNLPLTI